MLSTCPLCKAPLERGHAIAGACPKGHRFWSPNDGPQRAFVSCPANECLYGGAAGGGKSAGLIALQTRWIHVSSFRAIIFRRQATQLPDLFDKAERTYPLADAKARFNKTTRTWHFASGATVRFAHLENEGDEAGHDGHEYQSVGFDELTHFTAKQYKALRARLRSATPGLPRFARSTSNPGGVGAEWVIKRWAPWLDPECSHPLLPPRAVRVEAATQAGPRRGRRSRLRAVP